MSNIHNIENIVVKKNKIKFVFFDKKQQDLYNTKFVKMIGDSEIINTEYFIDSWKMIDKQGEKYPIKHIALNIVDGNSFIKPEYETNFMFKGKINLFLKNNDLPEDTIIDNFFFNKYIKGLKIKVLKQKRSRNVWNIRKLLENDYSAIMIHEDKIIGIVSAEITSDKDTREAYENKNIMYINMNLYISGVDIRPDYQGNSLCTPLVSYMIKNLKKLGYELLYISNASRTKKGIPACVCYYKSGIINDFNMRYLDTKLKKFKKMSLDNCLQGKIVRDYYYVSGDIPRRGTKKIKKHFLTRK